MAGAPIRAAVAGALAAALLVACSSDGDGDGGAGCGSEPAAPECRSLCELACARVAPCGIDAATCTTDCYGAYACPGETRGQDGAICRTALSTLPALCPDLCKWAGDFGGYGRAPRATCNAQAWQSFEVTEGGGRDSTWSVQPDGSLASTKQGVSSGGALSLRDLAALDAIISSGGFHDDMRSGFNCGPAPAGTTVRFDLRTGAGLLTRDVSDCILGGPDGNPAQAAFRIVSAY